MYETHIKLLAEQIIKFLAVFLINKEGRKVDGTIIGSKNYVALGGINLGENGILIHNHPTSVSFSTDDAKTLIDSGLSHMIVAGHDGTIYRMSKKPGGASLSYSGVKISERFNFNIQQGVGKKYYKAVTSGELSPGKAWKEHSHEIWEKIAGDYGLDYKRVLP